MSPRPRGRRAARRTPGPARARRRDRPLSRVVALDRRQLADHPVERRAVLETLGKGEGRRTSEPDQGEPVRAEEAPVVAREGEGIDRRVRFEPDAHADQIGDARRLGARGHRRPDRVAVSSWLSPPLSACRLTAEKPASINRVRSSEVGGR